LPQLGDGEVTTVQQIHLRTFVLGIWFGINGTLAVFAQSFGATARTTIPT
jgi:hypothetical protein